MSKIDELTLRKAALERRLAALREEQAATQEAALMLVPQDLLSRVRAGTAEDFAVIADEMEHDILDALAANAQVLEDSVRQALELSVSPLP